MVTSLLSGLTATLASLLWMNALHRLVLVGWSFRRVASPSGVPRGQAPVSVLVQLPLYNEPDCAERLIRACHRLDHPPERLTLQVLDDSTDETSAIVDRVVASLAGIGPPVEVVRREHRAGFKAGALAEGLRRSASDYVVIFDADFVPPSDFLARMLPSFAPDVAVVQARWGHLNRDVNWLTRAQAVLLDAHFVVEHVGRFAAGRWFNFNGTAGIWRREAILAAGGWSGDTVTEDLDLSFRAQLAGWRFVMRPDVVVPAELPATRGAFLAQQHRWSKGGAQVLRKLLFRVAFSPHPLLVRLEAVLQLCTNLNYPMLWLLSWLVPLLLCWSGSGSMIWLPLGVAPFLVYYGVGGWRAMDGRFRWWEVPLALLLGLSLASRQAWAVVEGLLGRSAIFVRTPKGSVERREQVRSWPIAESGLMLVNLVAVLYLLSARRWEGVPFPLLVMLANGLAWVPTKGRVEPAARGARSPS